MGEEMKSLCFFLLVWGQCMVCYGCPVAALPTDATVWNVTGGDLISDCVVWRSNIRYVADVAECGDNLYCVQWIRGYGLITHGTLTAPCYYNHTDENGNAIYNGARYDPITGEARRGCTGNSIITSCDAGYWTPYPQNQDVAAYDNACVPVGTGYWSPDGDLLRYPCPDGTVSGGYGTAADAESDCVLYKTLNTSTGLKLELRPYKISSPALHVEMQDGSMWYGELATFSVAASALRLRNADGIEYFVINPLDKFNIYVNQMGYQYYVIP